MAEEIGVGEITLRDIIKELQKPGRDPRDEMPRPILRTDVLDMKDASMDSWGGVSVNYTFRIVGGLGVGATFVYSGNNQRLAGKKISTDYYSIMPHLKMRWLNLRILSLYSRVGVGLTFTESSGEGQSESARQWAFQVSPIGVEIGGKVAAYAEAGIGTMGSLVAGLRFRF